MTTLFLALVCSPVLAADAFRPGGWHFEGGAANVEVGASVVGVGDLDGDGYGDVAAGGPDAGSGAVGRVWVFRGGPGGLGAAADWELTGDGSVNFGAAIAAGDVTGDGLADLVVGTPRSDPASGGSSTDAGGFVVYAGSAAGPTLWATYQFPETTDPDYYGCLSGWSLAVADVDGDGRGDVVSGAPYCYDSREGDSYSGRVFVFRELEAGDHETYEWEWTAGEDFARTGHAVASAGDVDGDGYGDVLVGSPYWPQDGDRGMATLFRGGPDGLGQDPAWQVVGPADDSWLGNRLAGAGDVDGDGYDDVIIGSGGYSGGSFGAWFYRGGPDGPASTPDWELTAADSDSACFGVAVAGAGDVDLDGFDDVVVGDPCRSGSAGRTTGSLYLFRGGDAGLETTYAGRVDGAVAGAQLGWELAGVPDVDGDGAPEVLGGSLYYASPDVHEGAIDLAYGLADGDGDGYGADVDCDDADASAHPGGTEVAGNEVDEDCDGTAEAAPVTDADGDGYGADVDCDDADASAHPGGTEVAGNEVDEDCDGEAQEAAVEDPEQTDSGGITPPDVDPGVRGEPAPEASQGCGCATGSGTEVAGLALLLALAGAGRRRG